jgi:starch phosphorylase
MDYYNANPELKAAVDLIASSALSNGNTELFRPLVNLLLENNDYLLLADYQSFLECQERVSQAYCNLEQWTQMSILNTARIGTFFSDRAIAEYSQDIWNVRSVSDRLRQFSQPQTG